MAVVTISQKLFVMGLVLKKLLDARYHKKFCKIDSQEVTRTIFQVSAITSRSANLHLEILTKPFLIDVNFNPNSTYLPKILISMEGSQNSKRHFLARKEFVLV